MKKYSHETVVGIFVIAGLLSVAYLTIRLGDVSFLGSKTYTLYADFESVSGLRVGNPVEVLGMEVGKVRAFAMDQDRQVVRVILRINKEVKVYDDAMASIRTSGLIGDKYVSLEAGGVGDLLEDGETITDTQAPIEITDLIGKFAFGSIQEEE